MISQHDEKKLEGERVYFAFAYESMAYQWRNWGQELKHDRNMVARADTETTQGAVYWLTPHGFAQTAFMNNWEPAARGSPTHSGHSSPASITNE